MSENGYRGGEVQALTQNTSIDNGLSRFMFPLPALWLIACFVLQLALANRGAETTVDPVCWAWLGSMWAGWAGCVWISSSIRNSFLKFAFLAMVVGWHADWMAVTREQPMLRYLVMLGGYGVTQTILFRLLRVPDWSLGPFRLIPTDDRKGQFSILELLLLTTVMAVLITAAKRYEPPGGQVFWFGSPVVCLALSTIATLCSLAMVSPTRSSRVQLAVSAVAAVTLGSATIAWVETQNDSGVVMRDLWMAYFGICGIFSVIFTVLAACGRLHGIDAMAPESRCFKTKAPPNSDDDESLPSDDLLPFRQPPHR
jgi:hypothetical protein